MNILRQSFNAPAPDTSSSRLLAQGVPGIVLNKDWESAYDLTLSYRPEDEWLPEILMLFNTPNLSLIAYEEMVGAVLPVLGAEGTAARELAYLCGNIGRIGYSFPQWRFPAQGFDGASLMERYGMTRLHRSTDVRDGTLPPGHPDRDHFGTGFVTKTADGLHIEYRRSYILVSSQDNDPATIVVRNNSFFFGRDRLPAPVYVSWSKLSPDDLNALDDHDFNGDGSLLPLASALMQDPSALQEKAARLNHLLSAFDKNDLNFSKWVFGADGRLHLTGFINHCLERQASTGKSDRPPFYIGDVGPKMPPWYPSHPIATTRDSIEQETLFDYPAYAKRVLLSSPDGDFPVRPEPKNTAPAPSATIP